ncbi:MAG: 23S rRNA (adenine(2503)-C(2))-methyltransferase RlmN [Polyangiaceae bacterium]|nr:23S rRNA (adenine(2503)-C(2))-methyltransferase RlmN [Polyangiaceae bacterium]
MSLDSAPPVPSASSGRRKSPEEIHPVARTPEEWKQVLLAMGERPFRATQIFKWIHQRGVFDPSEMSDLSLPLREKLAAGGLKAPFEVADVKRSVDGTRKLLLQLDDGRMVECVLIPMTDAVEEAVDADPCLADDDESESGPLRRVTLCISTQVGCAMGCVFCASGQVGLLRALGAAEVVAQVLIAQRYLDPGETLRNLVYMGMGEPLHHYDETARSIRLIHHQQGIGMGLRRITVSTVGLIPGLRRLGEDFGGKVGLAISLHAPDDATRAQIIPMNQRFGFADLLAALREYPLPARRRITIEYILIRDVNDSVAQARQLAEALRGIAVKVNLIPMNPIAASEFKAPIRKQVRAFQEELAAAGLSCFVRTTRGDDVDAACGQLALADQKSGSGKRELPLLQEGV